MLNSSLMLSVGIKSITSLRLPYAENATEEDIYAFDSAENWAECMNQLQYKIKELGERKRKAEKSQKVLFSIK